jgi:zinc protease
MIKSKAIQSSIHKYASSEINLPGSENITRVELPNGIVVLCRANFNSPSVVLHGFLSAGGIFDPPKKLGLANFTASMLMRGTAKHTFQEIYDLLESVGAKLSVGGGTHSVGFNGRALAEDLDLLLALLAEVLQEPVFPSEYVERLRTQSLTSLGIRNQDTSEMASLTFDQIVYRNHPYRNPEDGYPKTIKRITRDDLAAYHQKHFGPRNMILAIVGAVEPQEAVEKVQQALGEWRNPAQPRPPQLPPLTLLKKIEKKKVKIAGKSQADIVIGSAGPPRRSPDFVPATLGNCVLGQFAMMGRIGNVVREKAGLAYYASSNLSGGIGPGPWDISAGVDPKNINKVIDLILQELKKFTSEPVLDEEISDCKTSFIGRIPLSLESNLGIAAAITNIERHQLGLDYYHRYPALVHAVTPEQVLEVAQRYLPPDRLAIAIAGP